MVYDYLDTYAFVPKNEFQKKLHLFFLASLDDPVDSICQKVNLVNISKNNTNIIEIKLLFGYKTLYEEVNLF